MKRTTVWLSVLIFGALLLALAGSTGMSGNTVGAQDPAGQDTVGTAFTYQGHLTEGSDPTDGPVDFQFRLYNASENGTQIGSTLSQHDVTVSKGVFTVVLDFGTGAFNGSARYLEIAVRAGDNEGAYTTLIPRQELTAAPYAVHAAGAPWSGVSGIPSGFADGIDNEGTSYTAGRGLALNGAEFSAQGSGYGNVIVVAKSGGDYDTVQAAIDSIGDAGITNPYLVWVAPGVYNETVVMKSHVHVQGAGQSVTIITSPSSAPTFFPDQATLILSSYTSLRDLTVGNTGTGYYNVALLATPGVTQTLVADVMMLAMGSGGSRNVAGALDVGVSLTLQEVTALSRGAGDYNHGLYNRSRALVMLRGGSFTGRGGNLAYGIYNYGGTLEAMDIVVLGEGDSSACFGLYNTSGAWAVLHGGSITARGQNQTYGIYNFGGSTLEATDVIVLSENSSSSYGLYNTSGAAVLHGGSFTSRGGGYTRALRNYSGVLEATGIVALGEGGIFNYGLVMDDGIVRLGVSQVDGDIDRVDGTLTCFQVYDGTFASVSCP